MQYQIRQCLDYIYGNILTEKVIKHPDRAESTRVFNYPLSALEEAIANCIYHRDYTVREPIKMFIEADHIRLQNLGGPDRFIQAEDFQTGRVTPKRYRNRRLGDFLKGLELTEGHATGIRLILDAMATNGSPKPQFNFDEDRSYFEVEFPIHPAFLSEPTPPQPTEARGIPGLKITSPINPETFMQVVEQAFAEVAKHTQEGDRIRIQALHPLSIQLMLTLSQQKTMNRRMLLESISVTNQTKNAERFLAPLLELSAIEPTIKDRPQSPQQRYRLTETGQRWIDQLKAIPHSN